MKITITSSQRIGECEDNKFERKWFKSDENRNDGLKCEKLPDSIHQSPIWDMFLDHRHSSLFSLESSIFHQVLVCPWSQCSSLTFFEFHHRMSLNMHPMHHNSNEDRDTIQCTALFPSAFPNESKYNRAVGALDSYHSYAKCERNERWPIAFHYHNDSSIPISTSLAIWKIHFFLVSLNRN